MGVLSDRTVPDDSSQGDHAKKPVIVMFWMTRVSGGAFTMGLLPAWP